MRFGSQWPGGWMKRARFFVARKDHELGTGARRQVLEREALRYLRWRIIMAEGDRFEECAHMIDARDRIEKSITTRIRRLKILPGGDLAPSTDYVRGEKADDDE